MYLNKNEPGYIYGLTFNSRKEYTRIFSLTGEA